MIEATSTIILSTIQSSESAHQGMENAKVGDRELQATKTVKGTRIPAMTIQVDPGSFRAARITWSAKN